MFETVSKYLRLEQPLPPNGACLLGSFNLTKYIIPNYVVDRVTDEGYGPEYQDGWDFDYEQFEQDIPVVVRAMDNVVDRAVYPLPEQEREAKSKRRMGLGITGLANAGEILGKPYGSPEFITFMRTILDTLREVAYRSSIQLAKEKGPFPLFDVAFLESENAKRLSEETREGIRKHGIRNSHLLSIAPTGTISLTADNISSGLEPVFSHYYDRTIQTFEGSIVERIEDYAYRVYGVKGVTADELSVFDHVNVLNVASEYIDSACSKTCNVGADVSWEDFKKVYMTAYDGGASGCTTFRAAGKRYGILVASKDEEVAEKDEEEEEDTFVNETEGAACYYDPATGLRTCE